MRRLLQLLRSPLDSSCRKRGVRDADERLRARLGRTAGSLERVVWLAGSFGASEEVAAYCLVNLGFDANIMHVVNVVNVVAGHTPHATDRHRTPSTRETNTEGDSKSENLLEAVRRLKEHQESLRRMRAQRGLTPVTADAERGVTEVGPAMRARLARALEDGLASVEQAASILHVSTHEAYRWIVESGITVDVSPQSEL